MGFGSYDESEQQNFEAQTEDDQQEENSIERHEGEVNFENEETDDLLEVYHSQVE